MVASYEASDVRPDRDFDLYYSLSEDAIAVNLLSYKQAGEDGYFLLLVTPPVEAVAVPVAKDVVLVLDTSGSMDGDKIEQARAAASFVLDHLGPNDRFNVINFGTFTSIFAESPQPVERRDEGRAFVDNLLPEGSTNINGALLEALAGVDPQRPTIVIFVTDGLPTANETDPNRILANVTAAAPKSVRLFAFGVGYDVDTVLLDELSSRLRGVSVYVQPHQALDEMISAFYAKVGVPVLVDVTMLVEGAAVDDLYPYPLPDLFAGTQLVVAGRYRGDGEASIGLSGDVNGEGRRYAYSGLAFASRGGNEHVAPFGLSAKWDTSCRRSGCGRQPGAGGSSRGFEQTLRHHDALHLVPGAGAAGGPGASAVDGGASRSGPSGSGHRSASRGNAGGREDRGGAGPGCRAGRRIAGRPGAIGRKRGDAGRDRAGTHVGSLCGRVGRRRAGAAGGEQGVRAPRRRLD